MTIERALRLLAGTIVLTGTVLAAVHSPYWLLLTAFAGVNLFQSAFTNWCPAVWVFQKCGLKACVAVEPSTGEPAGQVQ